MSNKRCRPDKLEALEDQANQFIGQIKLAAYGLGTARFNLIGYSMGGLASRMIYNNLESYDAIQVNTMDNMPVYEKLSIESLLTIGSPHQGTLVADIIERTAVSLLYQDTCELRTFVMKSPLNPLNQVPLKIPVAMIASDADKNGNGRIEEEENTPGSLDLRLAKFTYWALYNYDYIDLNLSKQVNQYFENYILPENLLYGNFANLNDTMVTINSATTLTNKDNINASLYLIGEEGKNHRSILDEEAQSTAISIGTSVLKWGTY